MFAVGIKVTISAEDKKRPHEALGILVTNQPNSHNIKNQTIYTLIHTNTRQK